MRIWIAVLLALSVAACATPRTESGFSKPTLWQSPKTYLSSVPLGISRNEVVSQMGAPDRTAEVNGQSHWTYRLGSADSVRAYTYVFDGETLVDVVYNDPGPYNGARASQYR